MIFTVTNIIKNKNIFNVVSDTGESKLVTAGQILSVLLQGFQFTNVKLTKKGFAVATPQGTRYTQLNMNKETAAKVAFIVDKQNEAIKIAKQQQAQMQAQVKQQQVNRGRQKIVGRNNTSRVVYKGDIFSSDEKLCKKFNRDVNLFRQLRAKGYTMDEALGLMPLRPESELTMTQTQLRKQTDSYLASKGAEF